MGRRIYLRSFVGRHIPLRPDAYYAEFMKEAWRELLTHNLSFDPETGTVYESGRWIERPSKAGQWTAEDHKYFSDPEAAFDGSLARHVRARAARLCNRAKA